MKRKRKVKCKDSDDDGDDSDIDAELKSPPSKLRKLLVSEKFGITHEKPKITPLRQMLENQFNNYNLDSRKRLQYINEIIMEPNLILKDFQVYGVNWMIHKFNNGDRGALLGDERKTIQTCVFLREHYKYHLSDEFKPKYLVLCPLNIKDQWKFELEKWCPSLTSEIFYNVEIKKVKTKQWDVLITNYATFTGLEDKYNDIWKYLLKKPFSVLVFDEGHKLKNYKTKIRQKCNRIKGDFRILLTGTPFETQLEEYWSLLVFLYGRDLVGTKEEFKGSSIQKLNEKFVDKFILIRKKSNVLSNEDLTEKIEVVLNLNLVKYQKLLYRVYIEDNLKRLKAPELSRASIYQVMHILQDICDHPFIIKGGEEFIERTYKEENKIERDLTEDEKNMLMIKCSCKLIVLDKLLHKIVKEKKEKVLLYCHRLKLIDILEDFCEFKKYGYCKIIGQTTSDQREIEIKEFKKKNEKKIFLMSTKAGNLGLNLTIASTVILYNQHYNPFVDNQAVGRAHRIGQKRDVKVFSFTTRNTVEGFKLEIGGERRLKEKKLFQGKLKKEAKPVYTSMNLRKTVFDMWKKDDFDVSNLEEMDIDKIIKDQGGTQITIDNEKGSVKINDENFWERLFPNFVDIDRIEQDYKKQVFTEAESKKFLKDFFNLSKELSKKGFSLHSEKETEQKKKNLKFRLFKLVLNILGPEGKKLNMKEEDRIKMNAIKIEIEKKNQRVRKVRNYVFLNEQPNFEEEVIISSESDSTDDVSSSSSTEQDDDNEEDEDEDEDEDEVIEPRKRRKKKNYDDDYVPASIEEDDDEDFKINVDEDELKNEENELLGITTTGKKPTKQFENLMRGKKKNEQQQIQNNRSFPMAVNKSPVFSNSNLSNNSQKVYTSRVITNSKVNPSPSPYNFFGNVYVNPDQFLANNSAHNRFFPNLFSLQQYPLGFQNPIQSQQPKPKPKRKRKKKVRPPSPPVRKKIRNDVFNTNSARNIIRKKELVTGEKLDFSNLKSGNNPKFGSLMKSKTYKHLFKGKFWDSFYD